MKVAAELKKRDFIQVEDKKVSFVGCHTFLKSINDLKRKYGKDISTWPLPQGNTHSEILIREIIEKVKGTWEFPYKESELCHCRNVATEIVDQAIIAGAQTPEEVSRLTGAGTACGTCRPNTQAMIDYRLGRK